MRVAERTESPTAADAPRTGARTRTRAALRSPLAVAALVLALYGAWIVAWGTTGGRNASDFIYIGKQLVTQSHASATIREYPGYHYADGVGYDGQLYYYLALDPANARSYMDTRFTPPAYRYTRIVYPLAARLLALGQPRLVPYALIALNWLAVGAGTLLLGLWLRRKGLTPWLALLYALCPGTFAAVGHDLAEPLAFALVALAVVLYDAGGRRRWLWAGLVFAAAALTRETTAAFALVYGVALALSGDGATWRARRAAGWRPAAGLLAVALGPLAAYEVFLRLWLGPSGAGLGQGVLPDPLPYHGLLALWPWSYFVVLCFLATVPAALVCLGMAAAAIRRRVADVAVWALLANALLFSVWLGSTSYADPKGAPRYSLGIVVAALVSLPALDRMTRGRRGWLVTAAVFWLALLPLYVLKNG